MNHRRRTSMTSTSTTRSVRESSMQNKNFRSPSVGSATPKLEDDEDGKLKRSTRGRNPLPPTTGPLFPPLPPKQPKNSPKNSPQAPSRSPAMRTPQTQPQTQFLSQLAAPPEIITPASPLLKETTITTTTPSEIPTDLPIDSTALDEDAISARSASPEKNHVQSTSNASLTPPPPTSEDTTAEGEGKDDEQIPQNGDENGNEGEDDWHSYRRSRLVRKFGNGDASSTASGSNQVQIEVKEEPDIDNEGIQAPGKGESEETPVKTRRGSRLHYLSNENTPSASASLLNSDRDNRAGSASRLGRKRRGEDELLLDDHLLPAEIRRTNTSAKKEKKEEVEEEEKRVEPEMEQEEEDEDDVGAGTGIEVEVDEEEEDEDEEEEVKDVTRCVCQKEDIDVMMIQCDECNVWQHGECMGIWGDEEAPDEYFCEECKPERHQALLKWIRRQGRKSGSFIPPLPENLANLHNDRDQYPPSQSKRWIEPEEPPEPSPPPKPTSRSHHKKDQASPAAEEHAHDGRRSTRGRQPAPSISREKPVSTSSKNDIVRPVSVKTASNRKVRGVSSITPERDSQSPQQSSAKEPKKRSTMNSRDSAYEEAVKAALEASKADALRPTPDEIDETATVEEKEIERGEKRRRDDEEESEEKERAKKGKRKRDDDEGSTGSVEPSANKVKHPNQYTYRPKPPSTIQQPAAAPSPARRVAASTPVPSAQPAHHEHGTRRAGALAAAPVIYHPLTPESANHLSWFLPDHLSSFSDLLPAPNPNALEVPAPRVVSYLPRNHFHNQKYGPFSEERNEKGKLVLPDEPSGREIIGDKQTQLDPPARPRYPVKRVTTAEMRKRVRNVLEYVGRIQIEEGKRQQRAKLLGININSKFTSTKSIQKENDMGVDVGIDMDGDIEMNQEPTSTGDGIKTVEDSTTTENENQDENGIDNHQGVSIQLMDELTRDLIGFQESFSSNGNTINGNGFGFASPMTLSNSTFGNNRVPPTPTLPADPSIPTVTVPHEPTEVITEDTNPAIQIGNVESEDLKGMDVYRQGIVNTVVTSEEEKGAAEKINEIVAEAAA
ncbi:uncharacterized protein IL334_004836 [Kwoniella shivajii]|uniref:Zinc finger PHD-type domain-containing protein n=1 Tax=Kwoniella shivajii TaxID=564305 RepID=A0ABZ1D2P1_9TREE|nr:hypothetical protein IL334_004836 [Kwoniella shivajii]